MYSDATQNAAVTTAPWGMRLYFGLLLGMYSAAMAEVISGSMPLVLFSPIGLLLTYPIYMLHTLLLCRLIYTFGRPTWPVLVMAGALFGMYEAYITKVLWYPTWLEESGDLPLLYAGNIAWLETFMLVCFWHPFMAFIVPLLLGECLLTSSDQVRRVMPRWLRFEHHLSRRGKVIGALVVVYFGWLTAANSAWPGEKSMALLATTVLLLALTWGWRRMLRGNQYPLEALLPRRNGGILLGLFLLGIYLLTWFNLRPHVEPGVVGHAIVVVLYLVFASLMLLGLPQSRQAMVADGPPLDSRRPIRVLAWALPGYILACLVFECLIAGVAVLVPGAQEIIKVFPFIVIQFLLGPLGLLVYIRATGQLLWSKVEEQGT